MSVCVCEWVVDSGWMGAGALVHFIVVLMCHMICSTPLMTELGDVLVLICEDNTSNLFIQVC